MTAAPRQQHGLDVLRPYVPGKPIEEVQREYGLTDVIKLASNENPIGASPKVVAALVGALNGIKYYPDARAYRLSRAIARHLDVDPEMIRVGNGADGLIREVCVSYLDDGDEMLTSVSSFPVYDVSATVMRARIVKTPLRADRFDLGAMARAITERTKIIFVCNPNNPTGTMVDARELAEFMDAVPDNVVVVLDEAYYDFVDDPGYPDSLAYLRAGHKNVMILRTFSKAQGIAGIRLGYGIAHPDLLAPMRASTESFPVNILAQVAGLAALEDIEFMQETVATNRIGREYLACEFARLGMSCPPSQTNFLLVHVGPQAGQVYQKLLERGVIVRPCTAYDMPEHLRVTIGTPEQNERLIRELAKIVGTREAMPLTVSRDN